MAADKGSHAAQIAKLLERVFADLELALSPRLLERVASRLVDALPIGKATAAAASPAALPDREQAWFQTYGNAAFFLIDPDPSLVDIHDISHSLALQCRFNGHTPIFYSVAQHSELVARFVMERLGWHYRTHKSPGDDLARSAVRWALLHDAAEAYIGDVIRPLKRMLPDFAAFEGPVERAIATRFDLPWPMPAIVKEGDRAVLAAERKWLRPPLPRPIDGAEQVEPWPAERFRAWPSEIAERSFLDLYRRLYNVGEAAR